MRNTYMAAVLILISVLNAAAIDKARNLEDRWDELSRLSEGTLIVLDIDGQDPIAAKFRQADGQYLYVTRGGDRLQFPRSTVAAVHLGERSSRVKRAMIGALAGAGAGVAIGVIAVTTAKSDPLVAAGGFLIGIPVGAGLGAATGGKVRKGALIYSR